MSKKLLPILLLLAAVAFAAPRCRAAVKCNVLSNADGLSNSSVNCIRQDSSMMMWFGTWDGLNVYNGHSFKIYKFAPDNDNTISNNVIRTIVEESRGVMWVATDYGINRIDVGSERIERFYPGYEGNSPTAENVFSVAVAPDGCVFCSATGWGIACYDRRQGTFAALNVPQFNSSEVRSIHAAGAGELLLHTMSGAVVRIVYDALPTGIPSVRERKHLFPPGSVASVYESAGTIYLAGTDGTIRRFDPVSGSEILLATLPARAGSVRAMTQYDPGRLIVATVSAGVFLCDVATGSFTPLAGVPDVNILSLFSGSQGILWIGSDGQGVVGLYDDGIEFDKTSNKELFAARSCPVRAFYRSAQGDLYIGTKGNGIRVRHADGSLGEAYDTSGGLGNNFVYALSEGLADDIFIGHDGAGLDVLSTATGRISTIRPLPGSYFGSVYAIYRNPADSCLWLGTSGYGLVELELERRNGAYVVRRQRVYVNDKDDAASLGNNTVFAIVPASDGKLWVGTRGGGLNLFDPATERFTHHTISSGAYPISSNDILSLYMGRDSTLWIGTSYGLNRLDAQKGQGAFRRYVERDGLPNNTIHGILEDDEGFLWISTNKGLAKLNPATDAIVSYYNNEALQSNEFSDGAYYRAPDGKMYFGGVDGYNSFDPTSIRVRNYAPPLLFTEFSIKQRPVADFRPDRPIVLAHGDNFFSIRFSALEFIRNDNCEYAYILKGFNDEWVHAGTDHTASFTNVPPGTYEFAVRCTNGDKVWSQYAASLSIRVRPPWWTTGWAWTGYVLLLLGALCGVWFIVNERIEQRRQLLMETMSRQQQSDNYEAKLRFFTSIAHEFCTPLTLIYGSGEQLLDKYNLSPDVERHVRIVKNNASRMQRLIGELMEFRRVDTRHYTPSYAEVNLSELLSSVVDNFAEVNGQRRIDLRLDFPAEELKIVSDPGALGKIFNNLVSNAYKYTPSDGYIEIALRQADGRTTVRVTNSGAGIKPEQLGKVFNRFEILDNFERSSREGRVMRNGIGLSLAQSLAGVLGGKIDVGSRPGEYTTFTVSLPVLGRDRIAQTPQHVVFERPPTDETDEQDERDGRTASPRRQGEPSGLTVLVVDDERQIRDLIREILDGEYAVLEAADGQEAIELLKHRRPDLIISDITMPRLDGLGLLKYLKENEITKHIPFVFLTFKNSVEHEIHGYEMGGEAYINKPFHPRHLLAVVHRILNDRRSLKDYYNSAVSTADVWEGNTVDADAKKFIVQLTALIEENITDENLSLNFLCDKMFVSRMGLYRKITQITQMTPSEFIRSVKLRRATHLLKTTNMTIQEIMFCSGFNNKSYFYREFARVYGMSPREMREKNR